MSSDPDTSKSTGRAPLGANTLVFSGHVVVAAFVALLRYPCTQDGPAHLYTMAIVRALTEGTQSAYQPYFVPSLHRGANSLFFVAGIAASHVMTLETFASLSFFASLLLLPLSALAFSRALRIALPGGAPLPAVSAWSLACPLAYSYFLYRGLYNFSFGISFAFFCLAAIVAQGAVLRPVTRALLVVLALVAACLAGLAHAASIAFLFFAIPVACMPWGRPLPITRTILGVVVWILLRMFAQASHVTHDGPLSPIWWPPWTALEMFVRAFGVTHSYFEIIPALGIIGVLGATAVRLAPQILELRRRYTELWPIALSFCVAGGYFVVPNVVSDISGVNERLPVFAAMLLIPFVPAVGRRARAVAYAAIPFGLYAAFINARLESHVRALRDAGDAVAIERGAIVFAAPLDLKLGSVSADLGRYLIADIARRHEAITGNLFYGHPVFPVQGTSITPALPDPTPVQDFAHMSDAERASALADPKSSIRHYFDDSCEKAKGARYIAVVPYGPLDEAFRVHVLTRLGATPAKGSSPLLPIYELPRPADAAARPTRAD
jgi:hypothetical protein